MGKHPWEPSRLSHSNAVTDQQNNHGKTFISLMGIFDTILTSRVMGVHIPGQCWFGSQLNVYILNKILLYQYPLTVVDDSAQYRRYKSCLPAGPTRFWSCRPDSKVAGLGPTGRRKNRTLATSHYLNQRWPDTLTHICGTRGKWVNFRSHAALKLWDLCLEESDHSEIW